MRRKQATLLGLLIVGAAFWVTRNWWLPSLLAQAPLVEKQANLIQAIEALVSMLILIFNSVVGYMLWLVRRDTREERPAEIEVLEQTSVQEIRSLLGNAGRVNWVDRKVTRPGDLRRHKRIILTGRSRLGKTREAAELIRRAIEEDMINEHCVYRLGPAFRFVNVNSLRTAILKKIDFHASVLLFVDNFAYHFREEEMTKFGAVLDLLEDCKEAFVVSVARIDQLDDEHREWLSQHNFYEIRLPDLDFEQTGRLVDNAAGLFNLQVNDAARNELIERSNGTPELTLMALRRLRAEGITQVDRDTARLVLRESVAEAWSETKRYIIEHHPVAIFILTSLNHFHDASVRAFKPVILDYALRLAGKSNKKITFRSKPLYNALDYLSRFEIIVQNNTIIYPDEVVEDVLPGTDAKELLATFFEHSMRFPFWHWYYKYSRNSTYYSSALLDLALKYQQQGSNVVAIRMYNLAININPHPSLFSMRGIAYKAQGDLNAALVNYDKAIEIDPYNAVAYYNRGLAKYDMGKFDEAILDFNRTIQSASEKSLAGMACACRGDAKKRAGNIPGALDDYNEAIRLFPDDASSYNKRANSLYDQKNYKDAIKDYDVAIQLLQDGSERAMVYNNRGNAYYALGDMSTAEQDYNHAIALNPADPKLYANRGIVREVQGDLDAANEDYDRAMKVLSAGTRTKSTGVAPLIDLERIGLRSIDQFSKRMLDLTLVILILILLLPFLVVIVLLIKRESPGPVFYRRRVLGLKGEEFDAFLFRTLWIDAEDRLKQFTDLQAQSQFKWKIKDDPRITQVGAFLRHSSLDELPLLVNVLLGHMSFVGPRMISTWEADRFGAAIGTLLSVKPGVTGLWQISGRSDLSYENRIHIDINYIHNYHLFRDIQILFLTIPAVLLGEGAY